MLTPLTFVLPKSNRFCRVCREELLDISARLAKASPEASPKGRARGAAAAADTRGSRMLRRQERETRRNILKVEV